MKYPAGRLAVVTGAASGIGRATARHLLCDHHCRVALVDAAADRLAETAAEFQRLVPDAAFPFVCDVSRPDQVDALARDVAAAHGDAHILVNNAGIAYAGPFVSQPRESFDRILAVNFFGAVQLCRAFLPQLLRADRAHLIQVLSDFALLGFPGKSAYAASKFALRGFSEALFTELADSNIRLSIVYPGPVATDLVRAGGAADAVKHKLEAEFIETKGMSPDYAARRLVRAALAGRFRVRIGKESFLMDWAARMLPRWTYFALRKFRAWMPF